MKAFSVKLTALFFENLFKPNAPINLLKKRGRMAAENIFLEIGIIIIAATFIGYFLRLLRQPLIPAYILTGLLLGPVLGVVTDLSVIEKLSEIGIAFLLFIVGLEINFSKLRSVLFVSTIGGLIRIFLLFSIGYVVALLLGFVSIVAAYVAVAITFSSTVLAVKILADKHELTTLHGRIIMGMLLIEDFFAILALTIFSSQVFSPVIILMSLIKVLLLLIIAYLISKYILTFIFKIAVKSNEIMLLLAISTCFFFALMAEFSGRLISLVFSPSQIPAAQSLGIGTSAIIGAFIGGIALANLPHHIELIARIRSLKDFFAILFFVSIGLNLTTAAFKLILIPLMALLGIIITIKPFLTSLIISFMGYKKRTSFFVGIGMMHVSEFALIIAAQGLILGNITREIFSVIVITTAFSMILGSYSIKFSAHLFEFLKPVLSFLDKLAMKNMEIEHYIPMGFSNAVVLVGYGNIGYTIHQKLSKLKKKVIIIDYNPDIIKELSDKKVPCYFGDINDPEVLDQINIKTVSQIISTLPYKDQNIKLIRKLKSKNPKILIYATALKIDDALKLYDEGADYVIMPHFLGGGHVSLMLEESADDPRKMEQTRKEHLLQLEERKRMRHEHPLSV
ncbi:hypothetical protein D6745_04605 [Candidatus Woesearchaeota archaeon]|nr:MAG: hypothetical protein D6745_04605 [Candidatus Woesearchaeota archaeon]